MKESLAKITAWIKAHPIPAAIIGLVVVVVGYFVVKSSGGNSSGESIDGGSLGAEEASPLVGLGGGDMSTGSTTSTGTTPESIPTSTGGVAAYNDISTPQAAESIATYGTPSDYVNESSIFSGPTSAAEVFNNVSKMTLADSGFTKSVSSAPTGNKNIIKAPTNVFSGALLGAGAKPATPAFNIFKNIGSVAVTKPTTTIKPAVNVNNVFSGALLGAGAKPASAGAKQGKPITPSASAGAKPATPAFNIFKNIGSVSGYKWNSKLKRYVKTSTAQPLKAY